MATATIQQFVKDLNEIAGRRQGEIAQKLLSNSIGSMEEYKHQTGIAQGIGQLAEAAYQLMKRGDLDDAGDGLGKMPDPEGGPH